LGHGRGRQRLQQFASTLQIVNNKKARKAPSSGDTARLDLEAASLGNLLVQQRLICRRCGDWSGAIDVSDWPLADFQEPSDLMSAL
jgi:hypothetical protein